ncbi:GNAT family N-acetyltransferase [Clostridiaceae bacterium 35-E11]
MKSIEIISFEDRYHEDFKTLSYEWLKKYGLLEPEDERILNNPKEVILNQGGHIFFAKYGEEVVGTVSLIKVDENTFEIAKFAVTETYQGLSIGKKLLEKCLQIAGDEKIQKIILYSNHALTSALALYKKFNFKEIPLDSRKYMESDLKMELNLALIEYDDPHEAISKM